jgi:Tfp pilus assembly PilM family ATPase
VGLIVPDIVAKVSLARFAQVPKRAQDLDSLVRWQVKKTTPFPTEDAQVSYVPGIHSPEGQEFLVSVARRDIVEEYEGLCAAAGATAGIVDLATFNIINAVLASSAAGERSSADWLLVHLAPDYVSIVLLRGPHVIFFRNRAAESEGTLPDLVHQTAMYYEDRLHGRQFSRVLLAGGSSVAGADALRRELSDRLRLQVSPVDPFADAPPAGGTAMPGDALAAGVGILRREAVAG